MSNAKPKARPAKASPAKTARKHRASAPRPERHNQWTRQKMRAFLAALAGTASVTDAARAVGMSRQSAYQLRARLVGTPFDIAWEVALEHGLGSEEHTFELQSLMRFLYACFCLKKKKSH